MELRLHELSVEYYWRYLGYLNSRETAFSARKLGFKSKGQVSKFTDLLKRTIGNQTGSLGKIDDWIEPVGKAFIQTRPRISNHAIQRFTERGITEGMVKKSLDKGTKYLDKLNKSVSYVLEGGFASGKTMQTVVDIGENTVITVNRIRKFNKNTKLPDGTLRWIKFPISKIRSSNMANISFNELKNIIKNHPDYEKKWKQEVDIDQAFYISFSDNKPVPLNSDNSDLTSGHTLVLDKDKKGVVWGIEFN